MTSPRRYTASALILPSDSHAKLAPVLAADALYRDAAAALTAALGMPADAATWDPETSTLTVTTSPVTLSDAALTDALNSIPNTPDIKYDRVRIVEHAPLNDGGPRLHYLAPDRVDLFTMRLHTTPCTGSGEALILLDDLGDVPPYLHDTPRGVTVTPQPTPIVDTTITVVAATEDAATQLAATYADKAVTITRDDTRLTLTFAPRPNTEQGRAILHEATQPLRAARADTVTSWAVRTSNDPTGTARLAVATNTPSQQNWYTLALADGRPAMHVTDVDRLIFTGAYGPTVQTLRDAFAPHLPTT